MKKTRENFGLIADISGVVSTIGLLIFSLKYLFGLIKILFVSHIVGAILLMVAILFAGIFLVFQTRHQFVLFVNSFRKKAALDKLSEITNQNTSGNFNIEAFIPGSDFFETFLKISSDEAKEWSPDAVLRSYNFYIDHEDQKGTVKLQISYISVWKKENLTMYYPDYSRNLKKERDLEKREVYLFFREENWRKAFVIAFSKFASHSAQFSVQVASSWLPSFSFNFSYKTGNVQDSMHFMFKEGKLTCKDDSSEIPIA